jgi:hypothetical protein
LLSILGKHICISSYIIKLNLESSSPLNKSLPPLYGNHSLFDEKVSSISCLSTSFRPRGKKREREGEGLTDTKNNTIMKFLIG